MKRPMMVLGVGLGIAVAIVAACSDSVVTPRQQARAPFSHSASMTHAHGVLTANDSRMEAGDLDRLRELTAGFQDINVARNAGYNVQITGCMSDPQLGGMGAHFGNPNFIDAQVEKFHPEVLLYEPQQDGSMRFVALEYIVPVDQWTLPHPPRLFGQDFHVIPEFGVWALHAWIAKDNPSGIFFDWNPNVSCQFAR